MHLNKCMNVPHLHTYVRLLTCTHAHTHTHTHVYTHTHTCICTHMYTHTHVYAHMHTFMHPNMPQMDNDYPFKPYRGKMLTPILHPSMTKLDLNGRATESMDPSELSGAKIMGIGFRDCDDGAHSWFPSFTIHGLMNQV